jgi:hypothetical protein
MLHSPISDFWGFDKNPSKASSIPSFDPLTDISNHRFWDVALVHSKLSDSLDKPQDKDIFTIIYNNEIDDLDKLITNDLKALSQEKPFCDTPIFYAISQCNFKAVEAIINKCPEVLLQKNNNKITPIESAIELYVSNLNLNKPLEEIAKLRAILNLIYKKQFGSEQDLSDEQLKLMINYYLDASHLGIGYNKDGKISGLDVGVNFEIYKRALKKDNVLSSPDGLKDLSQSSPYLSSALASLDSIDKFDRPIRVGNESLYIFSANLNEHFSNFIFHVNEENKLTAISYCDGNQITYDNFLPENSQYLKGGVRKFKIESPIDFSEEFVNEFLKENSSKVDARVFYSNLATQGLKLPSSSNSESAQFIKSCDYLIPLKNQLKENCTYKSLKILWRYVAQLQNPELDFSSRYIDRAERSLYIESQSSDLLDATQMFKEFKAGITISAVERLQDFKEKLQQESFSQKFRDFFTGKIDETLKEVSENAEFKIAKDKSLEHRQLHEKIKKSLDTEPSFDSKPVKEEKPVEEVKPVKEEKPAEELKLTSDTSPKTSIDLPKSKKIGCFNQLIRFLRFSK